MWARGAVRNAGAETESAVESIKRPFRLTRSPCPVKTVASDFNGYTGRVFICLPIFFIIITIDVVGV